MIPKNELTRFVTVVSGQADRFGLAPEEYIRKIWYHEEAAKLGEYVAMTLVEQLLQIVRGQKAGSESETAG
ncbi:MAG: hypothetical protein NTU41_08730 [Chloroflexi bacterium]|nr:hypothetical protein [Chloroflexota bacterium]